MFRYIFDVKIYVIIKLMFCAFQKQTEYGDIKMSVAIYTISLHGVSTCKFAKQFKKIVKQKGLITEISTDEGKSSQTIHGIKITFVILS